MAGDSPGCWMYSRHVDEDGDMLSRWVGDVGRRTSRIVVICGGGREDDRGWIVQGGGYSRVEGGRCGLDIRHPGWSGKSAAAKGVGTGGIRAALHRLPWLLPLPFSLSAIVCEGP